MRITSSGNSVEFIALESFSTAIALAGPNATHNTIAKQSSFELFDNGTGIHISGGASHNQIGQDGSFSPWSGASRIGQSSNHGIWIEKGSDNTINLAFISYSGGDGVRVSSGSRNRVSQTQFQQNGGLPIDLAGDGPTLNDGTGDSDAGPNGLQNHPVLYSAAFNRWTNLVVIGKLESAPNTTFLVEFHGIDISPGNDEHPRFGGIHTAWIFLPSNWQGRRCGGLAPRPNQPLQWRMSMATDLPIWSRKCEPPR